MSSDAIDAAQLAHDMSSALHANLVLLHCLSTHIPNRVPTLVSDLRCEAMHDPQITCQFSATLLGLCMDVVFVITGSRHQAPMLYTVLHAFVTSHAIAFHEHAQQFYM